MDIKQRFAHAAQVAAHYDRFEDFAEDGMTFLGFPLTEIQADIAEFMETGPRLRMVMAQRGEAKSTLAALYAVWRLVQRPASKVLIVSGGETQASEVATLVIRIIMRWDILEYLRPDKSEGDKTSVEGFDVHYMLRDKVDKSPSVACIGVTAQLQGKRADLLIADDVETTKNGLTMTQRAHLRLLTQEFSSICTHGDILYLGTPQSKDSVYNTLPGRGYLVRIWPGRYPNDEELEKYGDRLAPILAERLAANPACRTGGGIDGTKGRPTDPQRYSEEALCEKELDQGPEGFQLQYMLDTSLLDAMRQQLKLSDLIVANFDWEQVPEIIPFQADPSNLVPLSADFPIPMTRMYYPASTKGVSFGALTNKMMYIDPAGGGSDELGFACSGALGPYIHALDVGGLKGGLTDENGKKLVERLLYYRIPYVKCESNMGAGLFEINLRAILASAALNDRDYDAVEREFLKTVGVVGEYSTNQKEKRIISRLVGAMQRHRVIVHKQVFASDILYGKQHSMDKRHDYSLWTQISNITTDRNSLVKDDRLEAFAGAVFHHKSVLLEDETRAAQARQEAAALEHISNPMGYPDQRVKVGRGTRGWLEARYNRK